MSQHAFVGHFEIPARDVERAAEFYRRALGWRVEPVEWAGAAYCKVRPQEGSGRRIGGGLTAPEVIGSDRPLLVVHLEGASMAACLERIVAAGGSVASPPAAVGEFGTSARFRDPEGNLLGLWQGREDDADPAAEEGGT